MGFEVREVHPRFMRHFYQVQDDIAHTNLKLFSRSCVTIEDTLIADSGGDPIHDSVGNTSSPGCRGGLHIHRWIKAILVNVIRRRRRRERRSFKYRKGREVLVVVVVGVKKKERGVGDRRWSVRVCPTTGCGIDSSAYTQRPVAFGLPNR